METADRTMGTRSERGFFRRLSVKLDAFRKGDAFTFYNTCQALEYTPETPKERDLYRQGLKEYQQKYPKEFARMLVEQESELAREDTSELCTSRAGVEKVYWASRNKHP